MVYHKFLHDVAPYTVSGENVNIKITLKVPKMKVVKFADSIKPDEAAHMEHHEDL